MDRSQKQLFPLIVACCIAACAEAASVRLAIGAREAYVGAPVTVQIVIEDADRHEPPVFPDIDGADVRRGNRSERSSISITARGRVQRVTYAYSYDLIPRRAGLLIIPAIRVKADGKWFETRPTRLLVKKSESGDLLFVYVVSDRESVYVGEPFDATLDIWLEPFSQGRTRLDENEMWGTVDQRSSTWGPFIEVINERRPRITVRRDRRSDADGNVRSYYVYSLAHRIWPQRAGAFKAGDINIVVKYPVRIESDFFWGNKVSRVRPIAAAAEPSTIIIEPLPEEDQPSSFRGAVGRYSMEITAAPTQVSVGDPITLTMSIRGNGQLDLLQSPQLSESTALTDDFKVPDESLAGVVANGVKKFTQSIRAKRSDVYEIPPIEFSYFDPTDERYMTIVSDSIPIEVAESTRLSVSQIVESGGLKVGPTELTRIDQGLLANYEDIDALLAQRSLVPGRGMLGLVGGPPLIYAVCLVIRRRRDQFDRDTGLARRRSARKSAMNMIHDAAGQSDPRVAASSAATAVARYVADRCDTPAGGVTGSEAIAELRNRGVPAELIGRVESFFSEMERVRYAGADQADANELVARARECVNDLERRKL